MSEPMTYLALALKALKIFRDFLSPNSAEKRKREARRFKHLYVPLNNLFLDRHPTSGSGAGAPYFRDRLKNALEVFHRVKKPSAAIKAACRTLFDKQKTRSAEMENGGDFPRSEIMAIARRNAEFADKELLDLISSADRATYDEMPGDGRLTEADIKLYAHIYKEHARLSRKYA